MKNGKKPTVDQRKFMEQCGLDAENWLIVKNTSEAMIVVHRHTGETKTIRKDQ